MAGTATLFVEQNVLGHTLAFSPMTAPTGVWLGLCLASVVPTSTTGGTEVAAGGYARQPAAFALLTSPNNIAANSVTIEYPPATAGWGTLGYFEVWSAATAGNRLYWGPLVDPTDGVTPITRSILVGDIVRFSAGVVQVQAV